MLPVLGKLGEIVSFFLKPISFGSAEKSTCNLQHRALNQNRIYVNIPQFFCLGDAFLRGQFRSKEGRRIYTHWHRFCNHELFLQAFVTIVVSYAYVKQKTKNPYSLSVEYSSNLFMWYEKI